MTKRQAELPMMPGKAIKPRIKRAHMIDAGENVASFQCNRCGWRSGWLCFETEVEVRRGIPCPVCNIDDIKESEL